MEKFHFRLEKLLEIRRSLEDESKRSFKNAQDEKLKVEEELQSLEEKYRETSQNKNCTSILEYKIVNNYMNFLDKRIAEEKINLKNKTIAVEEKRKELIDKQRDRQAVEKLRENKYLEYVKEVQAIEQKNNDEFALYGFIRNTERG
ncbi:flagellar export protein FliJ [Clostridium bornimense]|uniref:flagellar export protein FliJ n=1 Tax=Clostridium bornimense TaxID=1216932 RepID=UPI001C112F06|nr:flagellar export protein FliJ [Clostridium bornimense]MBU5314768.1 flagellar export protein FliJ [Clostridium bornimense]